MSFRREKYVPKGGPDGGDGGDGGHVYAEATAGVDTLLDFAGKHHWIAGKGQPGRGKKKTGRNGKSETLRLPVGTLIYDRGTGVLIKDLTHLGQPALLAEGGIGGRGNARFATATHRVPEECEEGTPGRERWLRLELKLIADVGIIGLPNAGKSTLLSRLSKATPKIADYPFTTLEPQLGIVELSDYRRFVMADIPGLIEGAHEGAGLGDAFLRHIERTRTILHIVDVGADQTGMTPLDAYRTIRAELERYSTALCEKTEIVAANKIELTGGADAARQLADDIDREVVPISAVTGRGLAELSERLWSVISEVKQPPTPVEPMPKPPHFEQP